MKRYFAKRVFPWILLSALHAVAGEPEIVRMATTTSTENSGLFTVIQPAFEQALPEQPFLSLNRRFYSPLIFLLGAVIMAFTSRPQLVTQRTASATGAALATETSSTR